MSLQEENQRRKLQLKREQLKVDTLPILSTFIGLFVVTTVCLLALLSLSTAKAGTLKIKPAICTKHPIYCQIKRNAPKLKSNFAMKLSNEIYKATVKRKTRICKVDSKLVTAIFAQESGYSLKAKNCVRGWRAESYDEKFSRCRYSKECGPDIKQYIEDRVCSDYGIGQINYRNIVNLNLDVKRLATDLTYSVRNSVKILCNFKRRYGKTNKWWSRYNARNKIMRKQYEKLVERYY